MPAVAPTPFLFTSDTVRIITLDSSVFPTCTVNDGGTITTVQFSQLFNYVTQSDVDFFIEDLTVTFDIVGYSAIRFYQKPANYMPLSALPTGYTYVNGVFTAPDTSSGGTVDLNPIYTAINSAVDMIVGVVSSKGDSVVTDLQNYIHSSNIPLFQLGDQILNHVPTLDVTPIQTNLDLIKSYTDTLETDMAIVKTHVGDLPTLLGGLAVNSLNGNGCEFKDGVQVNVTGRTGIFTVKNSTYFLLDDNTYTVLYELNSPNGGTVKVPETLCTLYVAPVTPDGTITIG